LELKYFFGLVFYLLTYVNFLHFLDNDDRMSSKRRNLSALVFLINSTILKLPLCINGITITITITLEGTEKLKTKKRQQNSLKNISVNETEDFHWLLTVHYTRYDTHFSFVYFSWIKYF